MDHGDSDLETGRLLAYLEQLKQFQETNNIVVHQKKPVLNHQESHVDNDYQIIHHNDEQDDDKENTPYHSNNIFTKTNSIDKNTIADKDNDDISQYLIPSNHDHIEADEGEDVYDDEFEIYPLSDDENVIEPNLEKLQVLNAAPINEEYLENAEKILLDIDRYNIDENVKMNMMTQLYNQIKMKSEEGNKPSLITIPSEEERLSPVQDAHVTEYDPGIESDSEEEPPAVEEEPSDAIKVTKTFDQLLEEKLAEEANNPISHVKFAKKPFLKKGQGIARFNGPQACTKKTANKITKTETKQVDSKRVVGIIRSQSQDKSKSKLPCKVKMDHEPLFVVPKNPEKSCKKTTVMSPQRSPNGPKVRTPGRSTKTMAILTPKTALSIEASPAISDVSAVIPQDQVAKHLAQQEVELEEFKMLELAAADKSMNTLMGLIHTAKVPTLTLVEESSVKNIRISSVVEQQDQPSNHTRQELLGHTREETPNQADKEPPIFARQEPPNHTEPKHQASSGYSEQTNDKIRDEFFENSSHKLEHNSSFEFDDDGFEDDETWGFDITPVKPTRPSRLLSGAFNNTDLKIEQQVPAVEPTDTAPSALLCKMFSGLRPAPPPPAPLPPVPDLEQESLKTELKTKLAELEKEVSRFQLETSKLVRVRNEKEGVLRRLREETDLFEKQQESEQKRFQEYKESEMKKIRAEKKQLEMSALSSVQRAAKLAEVDTLTVRVKELEDELTRKEGRWNTTHSRLKGRSEALEKECSELRPQITLLERQKLELWEKSIERSSNRRHKSVQTEPPRVDVQTIGIPTPSLLTSSCPELPLAQASGYNHGTPSKSRIPHKLLNPSSKSNIKQPSKSSSKPPPKTSVTKTLVSSEPLEHTEAPTEPVKKTLKASIKMALPTTKDQTIHPPRPSEWDTPPVQPLASRAPCKNVQFFDSVRSPSASESNSIPSLNIVQKVAVQSMVVSSTCLSPTGLLSPNSKGSVELQSDGAQLVRYTNGTTKHISVDGGLTTVTYFNGDIKKTFRDGRVVYKFKEAGITHCRHSDGTEVIEFPSGQKEIKRSEGSTEIIFPDKSTRITYNDGREESQYADGTVVSVDANGQRLIKLPNGQREVHTAAFKRREYPDGTTKTVFTDGRQETRYSNGRLRRKDAQGNIVEDVYIK